MGLFSSNNKAKLNAGLDKTKEGIFKRLARAVIGKTVIDDDVLDSLEETLISADVGTETTIKIINHINDRIKRDRYVSTNELNIILKEEISSLLAAIPSGQIAGFSDVLPSKPYVILVVGVNGVGKTTTIGKLAYQFKNNGKSVILGAADTFRAAAIDQIKIWGQRTNVPVIAQNMGSDPASVAFDTVNMAVKKGADIAIIDTAGRLHNKTNLMNELSKIHKVIQKIIPSAPHEVLLVLDASTGQNAFEQARQFIAATKVTSVALTKLDGTAKGGVIIGISDLFNIPVKFIGIGEKPDDLQIFNHQEFVDSLFY